MIRDDDDFAVNIDLIELYYPTHKLSGCKELDSDNNYFSVGNGREEMNLKHQYEMVVG